MMLYGLGGVVLSFFRIFLFVKQLQTNDQNRIHN